MLAVAGMLAAVTGSLPVAHAATSTVTVTATVCPSGGCSTEGGGSSGDSGGGEDEEENVSASVTFTGRAYPHSTVTILQDGHRLLSTAAGYDARFQATVQRLHAGSYLFAAYADDARGRRSPVLSFPVTIASNATIVVSGVFLAPTIATDKSEVRQGDPIVVLGHSAPTSTVTVALNATVPHEVQAVTDATGAYSASFDTANLEVGEYTATASASFDDLTTPESKTASFTVGDTNVVVPALTSIDTVDVNGDDRVNLTDFSVIAFWYKRSAPPPAADLNHDGAVTLVDFSILAFYWTG